MDGVPLDDARARSWMANVGYVPQSPYIFDGTLAENIAFTVDVGRIDKDLVSMCCRLANIDFIDTLENGVDSPIGERGGMLSGGQRQRVAIARALYREPEVLVFDEATSSLDSKSEQAILKTIAGLRREKTLIMIAHRLSTVADCDQIAWLDQGRLRVVGSPDAVLKQYREPTH
ncbi:ABC transporter ATP-binding protein/permease [Pseudodesulfovibrio sp.]|nr:ABC transporter ATP-binding protein/permease [Pseudodesulfovibrio sp.]